MDDAVGELIDALSRRNMLQDSLIIFSSDNGGPAEGFNINAASNWPLRGVNIYFYITCYLILAQINLTDY